MQATLIGKVADAYGLARHSTLTQGRYGPEVVVHGFAVPASEYRARQPQRIPLTLDHEQEVGEVLHLELRHGSLWMVGVVERWERVPDDARYFSPGVTHADGTDVELVELALTDRPASIAAPRITARPGAPRDVLRTMEFRSQTITAELLQQAVECRSFSGVITGAVERPRLADYRAEPSARGGHEWVVIDGEPVPIEHTTPNGYVLAVHR